MFQLRESHIAAFVHVSEAEILKRVERYLRKEHHRSVRNLRDSVLQQRIAVGARRAASYGINGDTALMAFLVLMFEVSPIFDEHPLVLEILNEAHPDANEKIFLLLNRFSASTWTTVRTDLGLQLWPTLEELAEDEPSAT